MKLSFPSLPEYEFLWRSIQLEPIPNSGETITIGAIVKGVDDALIVAKLVPASRLKSVFGKDFGERTNEAFNICKKSVEVFYSNNSLDKQWVSPIDGFKIGQYRKSVADDLESGLMSAARSSSFLSIAMEKSKGGKADSVGRLDPKTWRNQILKSVSSYDSSLEEYFDKTVKLSGAGFSQKFGFISTQYAAQFDTISASSSARHQALVRAQSKLWQLDQLRSSNTLFPQQKYELILHRPNLDNDDETKEFIEELSYEASRRELDLHTAATPEDAAQHILNCVA